MRRQHLLVRRHFLRSRLAQATRNWIADADTKSIGDRNAISDSNANGDRNPKPNLDPTGFAHAHRNSNCDRNTAPPPDSAVLTRRRVHARRHGLGRRS